MTNHTYYVVKIHAEGPSKLGHEIRTAEFVVPGINEADAINQVRTWIMMALKFEGPVLMRYIGIAARYCERQLSLDDLRRLGLEKFNPHDWVRFIPQWAHDRTSDGTINNCALANGEPEYKCQVCGGNCPDRDKFLASSIVESPLSLDTQHMEERRRILHMAGEKIFKRIAPPLNDLFQDGRTFNTWEQICVALALAHEDL